LIDDIVRIATVENELEAEIVVGLLRVEGIRAMWRPTDFAAAGDGGGRSTGIMGPMDVLVLAEDAVRAREILAASDRARSS
jgi:putative signal transducing protein